MNRRFKKSPAIKSPRRPATGQAVPCPPRAPGKIAYRIPFNRPCFAGREMRYAAEAFAAGKISGDGMFTRKCSLLLERIVGAPRAFLTTSCTHALEMAALLLGIRPGDEVILPSFTFVSTANAFVLRGAKPVFADIRPDTLNIDERALDALVSKRTRAICAVHYAGVGCEMDSILRTARRRGLDVVEDNAHGLFGSYRGKPLGSFGRLAAQSFHETKNITCGEGGALFVNDPALAARAEIIREKGTNRSQVFRGEAAKYTWMDIGSSYLPSEILAACLLAQLEARRAIQAKRRRIWSYYRASLQDWARRTGARLPFAPAHCRIPFHIFYVILPGRRERRELIERLRAKSILAVFHYMPLHLSPMGRRFGGRPGSCPVTEDLSGRILRLPFYADLSRSDQDRVIETVTG